KLGTAAITDVGMTGPAAGVIGMDSQSSLRRFVDHLPAPYEVATGPVQLNAVFVEADPVSGRAVHIERIQINE
ncbi:MAG: YmdB family metallophosphoesterase, partial [Saccharofermentanales bacterium]